jgi:oligoendopeptidase F
MNSNQAVELDLSKLPPYQKRTFVPENIDMTDKDSVLALHQKLLDRAIHSSQELERWLLDMSELDAVLGQVYSVLHIRMTCQTDDESRANAFRDFVENVIPAIKPIGDKLNRKYLDECKRFPLDENRYGVYDRATRADIELFRDENVPLQTQESLLSQEYQTVCGAMTVEFQGQERTLPQMGKFLVEPDRQLRESAWRATADRRLKDKDKLEDIFDKMLDLRVQIAKNAGFDNFMQYQFKNYHRFDYTPEDCKRYHATVEKLVVPVYREILEKRRQQMKLDTLRPWDLSVDPQGRPPLKPFETVDQLTTGVEKMFTHLDPNLGGQFRMMKDLGLLDLASRKGKAPGGYQSTLSEIRKPFIFMNAVGLNRDLFTLLHEGGHSFHSLAAATEPLNAYRHAPMEFCEVASMGMELLAHDQLNVFYKEEEIRRTLFEHFEDVIHILPWVATIDSFQHWIYENPKRNRHQRAEKWLEIHERFGGGDRVDWTGLDDAKKYLWHRQLHIFEVPFYYIEYGIAQLGALQLWVRARHNAKSALAGYQKALALGGSRPLPELFTAAGLNFDFSEKTIAPLMDEVVTELAKI